MTEERFAPLDTLDQPSAGWMRGRPWSLRRSTFTEPGGTVMADAAPIGAAPPPIPPQHVSRAYGNPPPGKLAKKNKV